MIRLTAYVSGRVRWTCYEAKVISLAKEMGLVGIVQNQPDGSVLVIAEGEKKTDMERFASAIQIKNALIDVENVNAKYTRGSGQYTSFKKITGSNEIGERLDEGIEILKRILDRQDETVSILSDVDEKLDQTLDKQDETIGEIRGLRVDLKGYMDMRFKRIEADLAELKEMKAALKEKGLI